MKTELNVTAVLVTFGEMARYGRLRRRIRHRIRLFKTVYGDRARRPGRK
jgi:hypothetical protein